MAAPPSVSRGAPLPSKLFASKKELGLAQISHIERPATAAVAASLLQTPPPSPAKPSCPLSLATQRRPIKFPNGASPPADAERQEHNSDATLRQSSMHDDIMNSFTSSITLGSTQRGGKTQQSAMVSRSTQHDVAALVCLLTTVSTQTDQAFSASSAGKTGYHSLAASFEAHQLASKGPQESSANRSPASLQSSSMGATATDTLIAEILRQKKAFEREKDSLLEQLDEAATELAKVSRRREEEQTQYTAERALHLEQIASLQSDLGRKLDELTRGEVRIMKLEKTIEALEQEARKAQSRSVDSTISAMENHLKKKLEEATRHHRQTMEAELIEARKKKRELQSALDELEAKRSRRRSSCRKASIQVPSDSQNQDCAQGIPVGEGLTKPASPMTAIRRASAMIISEPTHADEGSEDAALKLFRESVLKPSAAGSALPSGNVDGKSLSDDHPPSGDLSSHNNKQTPADALSRGHGASQVSVAASSTRNLASRRASAAGMRRSSSIVSFSANFRRNDADSDAMLQRMEQTAEKLSRVVSEYEASKGVDAVRSVEEQIHQAHQTMRQHYSEQMKEIEAEVAEREQTIRAKWSEEVAVLRSQLHNKTELIRQQHKQLDEVERSAHEQKVARELVEAENTALVAALAELQLALELDESGTHRTLCTMCHKSLYRTAVALTHKYSSSKQLKKSPAEPHLGETAGDKGTPQQNSQRGSGAWVRETNGGLGFGDFTGVAPSTVVLKPFSPSYRQDRVRTPFSPDTARLRVCPSTDDPSMEVVK
jgi:hypothetical protein